MIPLGAVGTEQQTGVPLSATPPASKQPGSLDAAHLGERRPRPAHRTVPLSPARGNLRCPLSVARVQQWHRKKSDESLKRDRIGATRSRQFLDRIGVLAQRGLEQGKN